MSGRPVQRGGQPRAAVQLARVAAAGVPLARGGAQVVVQAPALGVLLEPAAQARPLAQQRLVRDLDLALADRDQPLVGQHGEDLGDASSPSQLGERHAAAHDGVALALARQAQQDRAARRRGCSGSSRS